MHKKIVIGNLKMNPCSRQERDRYVKEIKKELFEIKKMREAEMVICPPAIYLEKFLREIKSKKLFFGAQNAFWEKRGAYTGENSISMIADLGVKFLIVGHSERRAYFGETDEDVNKKVVAAIEEKITPIVCVGETREERERGEIKDKITKQLVRDLQAVSKVKIKELIIAYEPIWAIGTGVTPTTEDVMEVNILIKKVLIDKLGLSPNRLPRIIYGGSVNFKNVKDVCLAPGMDGVLVGGESLHPTNFRKIFDEINMST